MGPLYELLKRITAYVYCTFIFEIGVELTTNIKSIFVSIIT